MPLVLIRVVRPVSGDPVDRQLGAVQITCALVAAVFMALVRPGAKASRMSTASWIYDGLINIAADGGNPDP